MRIFSISMKRSIIVSVVIILLTFQMFCPISDIAYATTTTTFQGKLTTDQQFYSPSWPGEWEINSSLQINGNMFTEGSYTYNYFAVDITPSVTG